MTPEADITLPVDPGIGRGPVTLLCVGNDEPLLSYRAQVLQQAGFRVISAVPQPEQTHQFANLGRLHAPAMLIACHTLFPAQRVMMAQELRSACPHTILLALSNGALTPDEAESYDLVLDSLDGPAALIEHIRSHV